MNKDIKHLIMTVTNILKLIDMQNEHNELQKNFNKLTIKRLNILEQKLKEGKSK